MNNEFAPGKITLYWKMYLKDFFFLGNNEFIIQAAYFPLFVAGGDMQEISHLFHSVLKLL